MTRFPLQNTPFHEHGVVWERFQRSERPPTAARRVTSAALSEARSSPPAMANRKKKKREKTESGEFMFFFGKQQGECFEGNSWSLGKWAS